MVFLLAWQAGRDWLVIIEMVALTLGWQEVADKECRNVQTVLFSTICTGVCLCMLLAIRAVLSTGHELLRVPSARSENKNKFLAHLG